jgi:hypothetical protein
MIAQLIGGFISILIGVSLIGPLASEVNTQAIGTLATVTPWGATVLNLVPGFFALGILGVGLSVTYSSLQAAGVL